MALPFSSRLGSLRTVWLDFRSDLRQTRQRSRGEWERLNALRTKNSLDVRPARGYKVNSPILGSLFDATMAWEGEYPNFGVSLLDATMAAGEKVFASDLGR